MSFVGSVDQTIPHQGMEESCINTDMGSLISLAIMHNTQNRLMKKQRKLNSINQYFNPSERKQPLFTIVKWIWLWYEKNNKKKSGVGKTRDGQTSVTIKFGKTRDHYVLDISVSFPWGLWVKQKSETVVRSASVNQADARTCWRSHHFLVMHWCCYIRRGQQLWHLSQSGYFWIWSGASGQESTKSQRSFSWVKVHVYNDMKYCSDRFPQKAPIANE